MTDKQALKRANERWGKGKEFYSVGGYVQKRSPYSYERKKFPLPVEGQKDVKLFDVGFVTVLVISMFHVKGTGATWEEAFAEADKSDARDKQRLEEAKARVAAKKKATLDALNS